MQTNDILAKLLANENLTVVRGNVQTASFDIKNRILVLPMWKELSLETEEMLILHEVGHAIFTPQDYISVQKDKDRAFGHFLNVIEDARIERLMKDRYPGSRKTFNMGYKYLRDRDFFEVSGKDLSSLNLIDRINLFYKVGMNCGVKFTPIEFEFIKRIDRSETFEDVSTICSDLYAYCVDQLESEFEANIDQLFADDTEDECDDDDYENDEDDYENDEDDFDQSIEVSSYEESYQESTTDSSGASNLNQQSDEELKDEKLQSKTYKSLTEKLQQSADTSTEYRYFEPSFAVTDKSWQTVIPFKRLLSEMSSDVTLKFERLDSYFDQPKYLEKAIRFKNENASIISSMVKEFEMRKSASNYKRARIAKTGSIDVNKLYGYKIKDDLFKQLTIIRDGKKHGMVFLLDWSGSMHNHMDNTCRQLINLVMFAKRVGIPFQVFAFTNNYAEPRYDTLEQRQANVVTNTKGLGCEYSFNLLELYSHRMTERELLEMNSHLLNSVWNMSRRFSLYSTPLNEALLYMVNHLGIFKKNNQVEKMIFITLTDGEGSYMCDSKGCSLDQSRYNWETRQHNKYLYFMQDPITGKQYSIARESSVQTSVLLNIIRDRYNAVTIGYNLMVNNRRNVTNYLSVSNNDTESVLGIQSKLRADKFVKSTYNGYDEYYIVDSNSLNVENQLDLSKVDSNTSAASASRVLSRSLNKNRTSRIILNKFATEVA